MRREAARTGVGLLMVLLMMVYGAGSAFAARTVLPAGARPHGYSLTEMAQETAAFTLGGNDPSLLPDTPFQVLYYDPDTLAFSPEGDGLLGTATNTFTVAPGTPFFVPLWQELAPAPAGGVFPTTAAEALAYFFDQDQIGASNFEVIVDGASTPIGPAFLSGPLTATFDGQEIPFVMLGAFLHPLPPGTHTVTVRGGIFGDLVEGYGFDFIREDLTYTVEVLP